MRITNRNDLTTYKKSIGNELHKWIREFDFPSTLDGFEYLTKASAIYSSNVEGNSIDLNSYMNYEMNKNKFKSGKEIDEVEGWIEAYTFAQANKLNEVNVLHCHEIFSDTLLIRSKRGKYRTEQLGVFGTKGCAYLAVEPEFVKKEMKLFFQDLDEVEAFYFASQIHLQFAHVHPFRDGNGRAARLIEKWFLAEKLGQDFWLIPSEEYYKNNQTIYYETIHLGVNFMSLTMTKA